MEQVLYPLPEGWCYESLGKLIHIVGGATPAKNRAAYWNGAIKWASVRDLHSEELFDTELKITEEGLKNSSTNIIPPENVVISTRVGLGKVVITKDFVAINQDLKGLLIKGNIDVKYLFYWLKSQAEYIKSVGTGATVKGVRLDFIKKLSCPLPTPNEQKRIVDKLDALLTCIDTAIEHLQESIKLADALFKSTLSSLVCNESTEHEKLSLEELGSFSGGGTPSKNKSEFWNGDILWVTPKDMKSPVITNSELKITQDGVKSSSAKFIPPGSVLIVARSGILRHTLPVCINESECTVNQDIKVFIPGKKVSADYIQYMLKGYEKFILSELVKGGVTVESLKYKDFQSFKFPIPSTEEQQKIVQKLSLVSQLIDPLKTELTHKINHLQKLKRSILDSAFKGDI
ncbi:MAG: restriction endonuclease subunit S [Marinospirillum sp.]|uniref:restriction endonuclease subunit S n=1 Tax=Marinospirillum sp. TaxID=2183934 RepID=UPI001A070A1E|nr:restriction endonuclease subunit S [Marinospirillum sp.]MBE0507611.1 restriction endonuclease subunit S [Marinospirillum sp.]